MFEELKRPFDVYHRFGGEFYVVHTFDHMTYPQDDAFEADCRKRSIDRLGRFNEICKENGVQMVAENIAFGGDERYLFNQEQFLEIFRQLSRCQPWYSKNSVSYAMTTSLVVLSATRMKTSPRWAFWWMNQSERGPSACQRQFFFGIRQLFPLSRSLARH
jgi:hypothetical protein